MKMSACLLRGAILIFMTINGVIGVHTTSTVQTNVTENAVKCCDGIHCFLMSMDKLGSHLLFGIAGFMTASLIFSVGCIVSKCSNSKPPNANDSNSTNPPSQENPVNSVANGNQEQKPEVYFNMVKRDKNSIRSSSPAQERTSYDLVEHNRSSTSDVNNDNVNPYGHVTADFEVTEYDSTSFVKPRPDVKDPTYSHVICRNISDPVTESENLSKTGSENIKKRTTGSFKITATEGKKRRKDSRKGSLKGHHKKEKEEIICDKEPFTPDFQIVDETAQEKNTDEQKLDKELFLYVERNFNKSNTNMAKIDGYSVVNRVRKISETGNTDTMAFSFADNDDGSNKNETLENKVSKRKIFDSFRSSYGEIVLDETNGEETQCLIDSDESVFQSEKDEEEMKDEQEVENKEEIKEEDEEEDEGEREGEEEGEDEEVGEYEEEAIYSNSNAIVAVNCLYEDVEEI